MVKDLLVKLFEKRDRNYVMATQVLGALLALITGKLIALYVSPEDFGTYGIQFATFTFFSTILVSPLLQFFKTSNTSLLSDIGIKPFASTLIISLAGAYILMMAFFNWYYDNKLGILYLLLFLHLISNSLNSILGDQLNTRNKLIDFSNLSILKACLSLFFLVIFFAFDLDFLDHVSALWAMHIIGGIAGLALFFGKYEYYKGRFHIGYGSFIKKYVQFGWPLAISALLVWISNYFDRYAIEYFLDTEAVGIYSASYGVGSKFFLVLSPLFLIMLTPQVYSQNNRDFKKKEINRYAFLYALIATPILIGIYFLKEIIGTLLLSESYQEGFYLIFWVAFAFFIFTLTKLYELYFYSESLTRVILVGNAVAAFLNILFNFLLIPTYGIFGAGISTLISFGSYFIVMYCWITYYS